MFKFKHGKLEVWDGGAWYSLKNSNRKHNQKITPSKTLLKFQSHPTKILMQKSIK